MLSPEQVREILRQELNPEELARLDAERAAVMRRLLVALQKRRPQDLGQVLGGLGPEERQKMLKFLTEQTEK